ncbi:PAS domain S-box-containing protein [Gemmobacter megaterium]|uniref:histidine kinase n=1 Tax=Gemmobacter megaterium TaxID=1086013 RepID=A0A1N7MA04_9RHOB|nr:PAS domain S-box protein [Gemmobacter megaterium]GGE07965.1 hypothetical protein GCM10011345_12040 [Gemmobacter megaterium]SIS82936.1 PAS domain S-box-containing protein [Gemmobacter megaterium]
MARHILVTRVLRNLLATPASELGTGIGAALREMSAVLGGGRSWTFLTENSGEFRVGHASHPQDGIPVIDRFPLPPPAQAGVIDATTDLDGSPVLARFLSDLGIRRCAVALMRADDDILGFLCCEMAETFETGDDYLPFLQEIAGVLAEVSRKGRTEIARIVMADRLETTLRALPDLLFEVDATGHYTNFAGGPENLFLVEPEQFAGKEIGSVLPPGAAEVAREAFRRVQKDGKVGNLTFALDLPTGRYMFDISGARKSSSAADPNPASVFLVRDVTEAHKMKEELRTLGSVTRAMSNLVVIMDTGLCVTWVNRAFETHTGWTLAEIRGRNLPDLVRCEESDPAMVAKVGDAIAQAQPLRGQMINKDRHGNRYHVEFNVLPLMDEDGTLQGFVSVETVVTELKQQQAAVEQLARSAAAAQSQLENAVNALPDAVMIFDAQERLLVCNPAQVAAFPQLADILVPGLALRDLLRISMERGLHDLPAQEASVDAYLERLLLAYRQASYLDEYRTMDGRWFRRVNSRTVDGGLIAVQIDITTRHNQMAALDTANLQLKIALNERAVAEQRLHNIMDWTRVGTWELDLAKGVVVVCRQWSQIVGLPTDHDNLTLTHRAFLDLVHPDDRHMLESSAPQLRGQTPDVFEHEFRMRHTDGHWVWVLSRGRIVGRGTQGEPQQFVGVDIDISEQKRLEQEVRQSDAYLTSAMESNVAAIAIYDDRDFLLYCNSEAEQVLRLKPGLFYGRQLDGPVWTLETLDGTPMSLDQGPCNLARAAGTILRDIRFAVRWSDGRRQILTCNATPVETAEGRRNTVISFWDITEQLLATERLQEALARAEDMSRAKSIFLANMSHEIRTPLNGVLGLAEVLGMQITNPEQQRMIATIRQSGETLLTVLNSILDMSKIEAGKMEIENVPLVLHDILAQIDAVYAIQADEKGLEFDIVASTGVDLRRIGDPHRIQQILHNLLSNAIKFSTAGSVTLSVSCRANQPVVFEVRDTGVGMTPEQSDRVFRSFEQGDGSVTRRFGGTGLGLSIVRELVLLMGGDIRLDSQAGVGTCVRVVLPLPMAEDAEAAAG